MSDIIKGMTPAETWERYIGTQTRSEWRERGGDIAHYLETHPFGADLTTAERDAVSLSLSQYLAEDDAEAGAVEDRAAVTDIMERLEFRVSNEHGLDLADGYAEAAVAVELDGEALCEGLVCWLVGHLATGASQDIDGSGLALWGSSQVGGWRSTHCGAGPDATDGRREIGEAVARALVARGLLVEDDVEEVVGAVLGWDFGDCNEPGADVIWEALETRRSHDDDEWRVGRLCGRNTPILAWIDEDGGRRFTWSPNAGEIARAAACAETRIKAALDALEDGER